MLDSGQVLGGRYALRARLARSSSGEVWSAEDEMLGRLVAVKVPRTDGAPAADDADDAFAGRLLAEARYAASVRHPGLAAVYDVRGTGPVPYLVRELVDGRALSDVVAEQGPLSSERTSSVLAQVAEALAPLHDRGLAHGDLRAGTVLVTAGGAVKVTGVLGGEAGPADDVAALGRIGVLCLTGREDAAAVQDLPRDDLRDLLQRMLDEDPARRPSAAAVAAWSHRTQSLTVPADLGRGVERAAGSDGTLALPVPTTAPATPPGPDATAAAADGGSRRLVGGPGGLDDRAPRDPAPRDDLAPRDDRRLLDDRGLLDDDGWHDADPAPRRRRRTGVVLAAVLLLAAAVGVGVLLTSRSSSPPAGGGGATGTASAAPAVVPISSAQLFHPGGSAGDHPSEVPLAVDGKPGTAWTTQTYATAAFGGLRPGVGLLLDLGAAHRVREVRISLAVPGDTLAVYAGDTPDAALLDTTPLGQVAQAPASTVVTASTPVTARYVVVWITELPTSPHQGAVSEVSVLG